MIPGLSDSVLDDYALDAGDAVEVELLVTGGMGANPSGPRLVEGTIRGATPAVLVLENSYGNGTVRVPWPAIALIRTNPPGHPAI